MPAEGAQSAPNDDSAPTRAPGSPPTRDRSLAAPSQIGPYRILSELGEGGFGVVYLAERREPHVQRVALKVIKPGMDSRAVVARFEQERQALAVMDHPSVARVYDGGATPDGRPYFVMELVKGDPITEYCDRERLSVRDRLALFIPVCEAVQHAHAKGVIHRDLKPSNVLVEIVDGRPMPKVIDFGVAKAIGHALAGEAVFTELGMIIGTPEYMSPEQAEMGRTDVDTRTDVYSLGVLLYELLTGALPFDSRSLRAAGYAEIQRIIREVDPPRPSTRLSSMGDAGDAAARRRRSERADELARELRRELEWIPLKAMRKDRTQRYRTPIELADDIANYLAGMPLIAGPESAAYRLRKFVVRRRAPLGAACAIVLALGLGLAGALVNLQRARIAERAALRQSSIASATTDFLVQTLESADPSLGGPEATVAGVLDVGAAAIDASFPDEPGVRAGVHEAYGRVYYALGRHRDAARQFEGARDALRDLRPQDDDAMVRVLQSLGAVAFEQGRDAEAERLTQEAESLAGVSGGRPVAAAAQRSLAQAAVAHNEGRAAEAERLYRAAISLERSQSGASDGLAAALDFCGRLLVEQGRLGEARPMIEESLAMRRSLARHADDAGVAFTLMTLGYLEQASSNLGEAERAFVESAEMRRRLFPGEMNPTVALALMELAGLLEDAGAERLSPASRDLAARFDRARLDDLAWVEAVQLRNRARILDGAGRSADADDRFRRSAELAARIGGRVGGVHESHTRLVWAESLLRRGNVPTAREQGRLAIAAAERAFGEKHPKTALVRARVGAIQ